ncbi:MAG: sugar ABC transporter permease [Anaerolineae bacterium]|nr:sugar ABC transporter permease [Anaerolineae bacterium]MBN8617293.1 sugar ABC transporter permease [Anaerolineae bacterium]
MRILNTESWTLAKRESATGYLFVVPWLIGFILLTLGPMLASLYFSFTEYNVISAPKWIGLNNYTRLFQDPLFWQSLKVTLYFAALSLPSGLILSFMLAVLLNQDVPGVRIWRTIYFLPSILSSVSVTLLWVILFNPQIGVVNQLLERIGIKGPGWLADPNWALPSLVIMGLWGIGQNMIIYLAGLQSVPRDLYDAAKVDGAASWQRFRFITIPMMSPVIFYNLVLGLIATFSYFAQAYIASGAVNSEVGGPVRSTLFYNLYLYQNAFRYNEMGYASAMAWVLFIIILLLTALVFRSSSLWVYYEGELRAKS